MRDIVLRPATPADLEFGFRLHRAAMGAYVAAVWGWDEAAQRAYWERNFDPADKEIITVDGVDIGFLNVERRPTETYLGGIEIHPDHQGRGIGSQIIRAVLDEAAERHHDVVLDVLTVNRRAKALYQRLGFRAVARLSDHKIRMQAKPPTQPPHDSPSAQDDR